MITEEKIKNSVKPFTVSIPQSAIDDLKMRLKNTRWPDEVEGAGWDYGTNSAYLKELVNYWQQDFDWREQENKINQFKNYKATIDGIGIHFIHEKNNDPDAIPLVLMHGWPSTFVQMFKILPLLKQSKSPKFHLIVPSLIGYGFSDRPSQKGINLYEMATRLHKLITEELGYEKYAIRAGDLGAGVGHEMAVAFPDAVIGLHMSGSNPNVQQMPENLSEAEKEFVKKVQGLLYTEAAYALLQSTKPQTVAFALNDSPVGLAAWIVEKYRSWSDSNGNIETKFSKDELLTNISIYWFTQTINSSMRLYYESSHVKSEGLSKPVKVRTGFAMPPKDIAIAPREWEERKYNVLHWTQLKSGGHFSEQEEAEAIAEDIRIFFQKL